MLHGSWCICVPDSSTGHVLKYLPCSEPPQRARLRRNFKKQDGFGIATPLLVDRAYVWTGQPVALKKITIIISTQTQEHISGMTDHCQIEASRMVPGHWFPECPGPGPVWVRGGRLRGGGEGVDMHCSCRSPSIHGFAFHDFSYSRLMQSELLNGKSQK